MVLVLNFQNSGTLEFLSFFKKKIIEHFTNLHVILAQGHANLRIVPVLV